MQSVCLQDFVQYFPYVPQEDAQKLYTQPFYPKDLLNLFEGWEYFDYSRCYIDNSEDRNIIRFEDTSYIINAEQFRHPVDVNEFISDCQKVGVKLLWSEEMAEKLWCKPPLTAMSR